LYSEDASQTIAQVSNTVDKTGIGSQEETHVQGASLISGDMSTLNLTLEGKSKKIKIYWLL